MILSFLENAIILVYLLSILHFILIVIIALNFSESDNREKTELIIWKFQTVSMPSKTVKYCLSVFCIFDEFEAKKF